MSRFSNFLAVVFLLSVALTVFGAEKTSIKIEGMTCNGCVSSVSTALKNVDGVSKVNVSLKKGIADVEFDAQKTSIKKLETTIASLGYDAGDVQAKNPHKCKDEMKSAAVGECCKSKAKKGCCEKK